jgi:hypothetical protein
MKKLILAIGLSLVFGGVAFAKPGMVKGAKCAACHTEAMGKKTNVSQVSQDMQKKFADKKCADCHGATADGMKLTCTDPATCKKK